MGTVTVRTARAGIRSAAVNAAARTRGSGRASRRGGDARRWEDAGGAAGAAVWAVGAIEAAAAVGAAGGTTVTEGIGVGSTIGTSAGSIPGRIAAVSVGSPATPRASAVAATGTGFACGSRRTSLARRKAGGTGTERGPSARSN